MSDAIVKDAVDGLARALAWGSADGMAAGVARRESVYRRAIAKFADALSAAPRAPGEPAPTDDVARLRAQAARLEADRQQALERLSGALTTLIGVRSMVDQLVRAWGSGELGFTLASSAARIRDAITNRLDTDSQAEAMAHPRADMRSEKRERLGRAMHHAWMQVVISRSPNVARTNWEDLNDTARGDHEHVAEVLYRAGVHEAQNVAPLVDALLQDMAEVAATYQRGADHRRELERAFGTMRQILEART